AIDFVPRAIGAARRKAEAANISPQRLLGDVTRLDDLGVGDGFSLVFDLGCLHSIPEGRRDAYAAGVTKAAAQGADFLVWGFYTKPNFFINARVTRDELERRFGGSWGPVRARGWQQPAGFRARWYPLRRR